MRFKIEVKDTDKNKNVVVLGDRFLGPAPTGLETVANWVKVGVPRIGQDIVALYSSGALPKEKRQTANVKAFKGQLGYFHRHGNDLGTASQKTILFSGDSAYADGHGCSIFPSNFENVISMFTARKLLEKDWVADKEQIIVPNTKHEDYQSYTRDALIFSLFNTSSQQISSNNVLFEGESFNIKNHFFFMSKDEIKELANKESNTTIYRQVAKDEDSFVYNLIMAIEEDGGFSGDAKEILERARDIVRITFKYRNAFDSLTADEIWDVFSSDFNNKEEVKGKIRFDIQNWDAGWYQIKKMCKWISKISLDKEVDLAFKDFEEAYLKFGKRIKEDLPKFEFLASEYRER